MPVTAKPVESNQSKGHVRFEVLLEVAMKIAAFEDVTPHNPIATRVGTLIVATIYLQLIQNRYMFRSFTVLQCSHQHCVQPVVSDVEVIGYL